MKYGILAQLVVITYVLLSGAHEMRLNKDSEAFGSVVNENELAQVKSQDFKVADIIPYLKVCEYYHRST